MMQKLDRHDQLSLTSFTLRFVSAWMGCVLAVVAHADLPAEVTNTQLVPVEPHVIGVCLAGENCADTDTQLLEVETATDVDVTASSVENDDRVVSTAPTAVGDGVSSPAHGSGDNGIDTSKIDNNQYNRVNRIIDNQSVLGTGVDTVIANQSIAQARQDAIHTDVAQVMSNQSVANERQSQILSNQQKLQANQQSVLQNQENVQSSIMNNQKKLATNQYSMLHNQVVNQGSTQSNQKLLKQNQSHIHYQQYVDKVEIIEEIQKMLDKGKLQDSLYGGGPDADTDNFLIRLEQALNSMGRDPQASSEVNQSSMALLSLLDGADYQQALQSDMREAIALIMSGAGNKSGSADLTVTDVIPTASDPFTATATAYNSLIYPLMEDENQIGKYTAAACSARMQTWMGDTGTAAQNVKFSSGLCDVMIAAEYARVLVSSCADDYKTTCSSAASGIDSASQGKLSIDFKADSYPDGACGCMSKRDFVFERDETWNGWQDSRRAVVELYNRCNDIASTTYSEPYTAAASQFKSACSAVNAYINESGILGYPSGTTFDANSAVVVEFETKANSYLAQIKPLIVAITDSARPLLFWQVYDTIQSSNSAELQNYGSMWTLTGPDSYASDTPSADLGSYCNSVMLGYIADPSQYTVQVQKQSEASSGSEQALLADLYMNQLLSNVRFPTILSSPSVSDSNAQCSAVIAKNGRFICLNNQGVAQSSSTSYTTVSVPNIDKISADQSQTSTAIDQFVQMYRGLIAPLNIQKLFTLSMLRQSYNDRNIMLEVSPSDTSGVASSSSGSCKFTAMQAMHYALSWRMDPQYVFNNADSGVLSGTTTAAESPAGVTLPQEKASGNWAEHIASSNTPEVLKEIATLMQLHNYMNGKLYRQQEKLSLLMTLMTVNDVEKRRAELKSRADHMQLLIKNYYKGASSPQASPAG